jgi:hypothetical protein
MSRDEKLSKLAYNHIYGTKMLPDSDYPLKRNTPLSGVPEFRRPSSPDTWSEFEWKNKVNKGIS